MFIFRLNKIKVLKNRERKKFLGLFGKDEAEVRIMSFISTEFTEMPNLDELMKATDAAQQDKLLEALISTVLSRRVLTTVENVRDGQVLTFGDTGYSVFYADKIPDHFDWLLTVIESDQPERDEAKWMSDILKSKKFKGFKGDLLAALKASSQAALLVNPAFLASVAIGRFAIDVLLQKGRANKDDQLGLLYMSLNRPQHYMFGKRDVQDIDDLTGNIKVDYSLFGVDDLDVEVSPKPTKTKTKTTKTKAKKPKTTPAKTKTTTKKTTKTTPKTTPPTTKTRTGAATSKTK